MCKTRKCCVSFIILCWTAILCECSDGSQDTFPHEFDFRYTSYNELIEEAPVFNDEDIIGFTQLTLDEHNDQLLVGARNSLFSLRLDNLIKTDHANVTVSNSKLSKCRNIGRSKEVCQNFIRVLLLHNYTTHYPDNGLDNDQAVFVCGTEAFSPACTWRSATNLSHVIELAETGIGRCPFNPFQNSTALITANGDFYSATMLSLDRDPAIYRTKGAKTKELRTELSNSKWLNEPDFVSTYEIGDFVYFFFREVAVEFINCGKRIYSRVARVCKTDEGGVIYEKTWTTYFKSRLNCSLPGEYPFYYDEIQSTYYLADGDEKYLYAVFTTPRNSIAGSAVCVYDMKAFDDSFTGHYKYQETPSDAWVRHDNHNPLTKCPERKETNKRSNEDLMKDSMLEAKYQLMDSAVQPITQMPLLHEQNERWTHVVVQNVAGKRANYKVVFVATADGKLRKMMQLPTTNETCLIEEIKIVPNGEHKPVKAMKISSKMNAIYISTQKTVIKIPVERCSRFTNIDLCINAMDPYCGWNEAAGECSPAPSRQPEVHYWLQSIERCPFIYHSVNGGWSTWEDWHTCSQVGNDITLGDCKCRSRSCDNPKPFYGGQSCVGASVEVANCTAHGQWTDWSTWSTCSQSCGSTAIHRRERHCSNPPPRHGGRNCIGSSSEEEYCQGHPPCPLPPVQGNWTEWTDWSECSAKCNGGIQTRRRSCNTPPPMVKSIPCVGCNQEWRMCNTQICGELHQMTPWTPWVSMNHTKGGYFEERFRFMCHAKVPSQSLIRAKHVKTQTRFCFDGGQCRDSAISLLQNIDGGWSEWSTWTACTRECDSGLKWRHRRCNNPAPLGNGMDCVGHVKEGQECNSHSCQGVWSCWSELSTCSVSCGQGVLARTRHCQSLPPGNVYTIPCAGDTEEFLACDEDPCINIALAQSVSDSFMEKPRFNLAQMFLVGGLSFFLGGSASIALYAYIKSFHRAMKYAKQQERVKKLEKALRHQKDLQRKMSKVSMKPLPSLASQASLDNIFGAKNRVYDVETMMRDSVYDREPQYSTLDRQCALKTFTIKDL